MRVISGEAKGKKLYSLEGISTRPTLDRVKEALFNIIQYNIKDSVVLDLFSGSGAIGIEALSREAKKVVLCDNSHEAIKIIQKNLENTKLQEKAVVINRDYIHALRQLEGEKFNIIFLDPPYKTDFVEKSIEEIVRLDLLAEEGIIIVETNDDKKVILREKNIEIFDERKYGKVLLIFIRKG